MKMKKSGYTITGIAVFAIIVLLNMYREFHLNHDKKEGQIIQQSIESVEFEDIFTPAEANFDANLEKPEVKMGK